MDALRSQRLNATKQRSLDRLARWLDVELMAGGGAVATGFFLPMSLLVGLASLAVLAFTPLLVHALWTLGKRGWLLAFGAFSGLPALAGFLAASPMASALGIGAGLVFYFGLCTILRPTVHQWREDAVWRTRFLEDAAEARAGM